MRYNDKNSLSYLYLNFEYNCHNYFMLFRLSLKLSNLKGCIPFNIGNQKRIKNHTLYAWFSWLDDKDMTNTLFFMHCSEVKEF